MKTFSLRSKIGALTVLTSLFITACSSAPVPNPSALNTQNSQMSRSMANQMLMINDDKSFLEHMIPHHEEAISVSELLLTKSTNQELRALATTIIAAQKAEVTQMKSWYQTWFGSEYQSTASYMPMMRDLRNLDSKTADALYIDDMIQHHNSAIVSANSLLGFTKRPELTSLANNIISTQAAESGQLINIANDILRSQTEMNN